MWHRAGCCGGLVESPPLLVERGNAASPLVPVADTQAPRSVSGLVEEDVARLGVLGDFRSQAVEFLYGLRVDFLQEGDTQEGVEDGKVL